MQSKVKLVIREAWRLPVGIGPAEHGVYKFSKLWLAATYRDSFWEVDPRTGRVICEFRMPGHVWGAPWVESDSLYGASLGGYVRRFSLEGTPLWTINPGLGDFIAESITEAWGRYLAVQFKNGIAILEKDKGRVLWRDAWTPEVAAGQEPTYDRENSLLWVCKPTRKQNLVAYAKDGDRVFSLTLPSYPTNYACPQIWSEYLVVVCSRHVAVIKRDEGALLWYKDYGTAWYGGKEVDALMGGPRTLTPDGKLIVWTANGLFQCLDVTSGESLWKVDLASLGYASSSCTAPWGYAGGVAADGIFLILGRNNLPAGSGTPYDIDKNRLLIIDYDKGIIVGSSDPIYLMACCCKPIVARGRVVIGSWFKDSKNNPYEAYYYCWEISAPGREPEDKEYEWMGGLHHGGYCVGCLLGSS